jgi:luciferase family oxidoreductase group 1
MKADLMKISILDHGPLSAGSSVGDAYWHSTELAQLGEELGFERYWLAEHHNTSTLVGAQPVVLAAHVAARTSTIRVGTGGLLLSNSTPLAAVEQMGLIEALHPGRIDLGLGRAPGADQVTAAALRAGQGDFAQKFAELLAFYDGTFPEDHPYSQIIPMPGRGNKPALYLLGSGTYSAQLAGALGLPFAHGGHFAGGNSVEAVQIYRDAFRPSETLKEPYAIVSVGAVCQESDELAQRLHHAALVNTVHMMRGNRVAFLPPEEVEAAPWADATDPYITEVMSHYVVGSPATVKAGLEDLSDRTGANEFMIATTIYGYDNRLTSYRLIGEAFQKEPSVR